MLVLFGSYWTPSVVGVCVEWEAFGWFVGGVEPPFCTLARHVTLANQKACTGCTVYTNVISTPLALGDVPWCSGRMTRTWLANQTTEQPTNIHEHSMKMQWEELYFYGECLTNHTLENIYLSLKSSVFTLIGAE